MSRAHRKLWEQGRHLSLSGTRESCSGKEGRWPEWQVREARGSREAGEAVRLGIGLGLGEPGASAARCLWLKKTGGDGERGRRRKGAVPTNVTSYRGHTG